MRPFFREERAQMQTDFSRMFDLTYPIVAAPMFLVSTSALVKAAAEAGIMGTFPALNYRPIEAFAAAVQDIKKATKAAIGVNIIVQEANRLRDQQIDIALQEGVELIITSLGNPRTVIERAKGTKTRVFCDVVNLQHAEKVRDLGADGLIAVSHGAGGHAGTISPFVLIPRLRQATSLPVLAAGNIVDGRGLAAALALGASGAYIGTRFIASEEAEVDADYKQSIVDYDMEDIVSTHKVDGFPGNFILTPRLRMIGPESGFWELALSRSAYLRRVLAMGRAARALFKKNDKNSYKTIYSAGQGIGLIEETKSVAAIVEEIVSGYRRVLANLPPLSEKER
jgi:nitronate monooxygenase